MIKLTSDAGQAIRSFLAENKLKPSIRIDLRSSGCCDASLALSADTIREDDLVEELDGITFLIDTEIDRLVGDITISYVDDLGIKGFALTSSRPVSEWSNFGVCTIRTA
jgi:Fe-S cluster assembly iron-binding protein IscA